MSCCSAVAASGACSCGEHTPPTGSSDHVDPSFVTEIAPGQARMHFLVPDMHCAGCLWKLERALLEIPGVTLARANLTARRIAVEFDPAAARPEAMLDAIAGQGYAARPFDLAAFQAAETDEVGTGLVRAMAVAGFASSNVMLLSVAVWSGATDATRDLFHWVSALIAIPTVLYSGQIFFRSAARALLARSLNMDVPISLGVILATAMSLYESATSGRHAWFDGAVALLFFLLVGRFLEHRMRDVARSAAAKLMSLSARSAMRVEADGSAAHVPIGSLAPGDLIRVAAGERVPVDGLVSEGASDVDRSMLTGEAEPEPVGTETEVFAGTLNLTGPLTIAVRKRSADTLLADIVRLMEAAERSGGRFVRVADEAARRYAPAVHLLALTTLLGWLAVGAGWHAALNACVAVLIITCPCALGLAVPAVQVVASGFLLKRCIMLKDGNALERLATVTTVVFDKTGTLTEGEPELVDAPELDVNAWSVARGLGEASRHPLARGLAAAAQRRDARAATLSQVSEIPGSGMAGLWNGVPVKLGRREWVGGADDAPAGSRLPEIWLRIGDGAPLPFRFEDALRADAAETVAALRARGLKVLLLSGDREEAVAAAAARTGISEWRSRCSPADKARMLAELEAGGDHVLMVGDGINDAPALASASVSMSPASASDISQTAAGIVFTGRRLAPVLTALRTAREARRTILQNFVLAIGYNTLAVPIAIAGFATPLIAAVAMSTSSIIVTGNSLRLPLILRERRTKPTTAVPVLAQEQLA